MKTLYPVQVIIMDNNEVHYNYKGVLYTEEQFQDLIKETKINTEKANKIFYNAASRHDNYEDIKEELRNLHSCEELTDNEYNYLLKEWDNLLVKYNL